MSELGPTAIIGIGGFIIGLVFGGAVQRTNFCTMGGISDLVITGDGRRFRAWVLAIAVAIIGTQALHFSGAVDINTSIYLTSNFGWLGAILGGTMFGFGMTQAGGCGSKALVRLGAGNLKSLIVTVVLGIAAYMTLRGLFALARVQLETATNVDLKTHGLATRISAKWLARRSAFRLARRAVVAAAVLALVFLIFCFKDAMFRRSARDITAGLIVGLAAVAGWVVTGVLAADEFNPVPLASVTFVAPVGESLQYLMTFTGSTINFGIAVVGGVIVGSFLMAVTTGTFQIESFTDRNDFLRHLAGAGLMGVGGVMALGCTIGQGVTGMATLSLGSLIAWLSILGGGYLGVKFLEEGSFGGAIRAVFARG